MLTTSEALLWRYATKKFDATRKLVSADIELLLESLRFAPSSYGLQPWKFYLVENADLRQRVQTLAWNQPQVTDASHLIALAHKTSMTEEDVHHYVDHIKVTRGVTDEDIAGYRDMMLNTVRTLSPERAAVWNSRQVYLALGFLLSAAAHNEIDACPMEGFDAPAVSELIGATAEGYAVVVLCPVGYRSEADEYARATKVRATPKEVLARIA